MREMTVTFVNVGYGEAVLLRCPDPACRDGEFVMLVDGGSADPAEFADRSSGRIPLWEYLKTDGAPGHIDLMVNTHPHEDHVCGMLRAAAFLPPRELWQILPPEFCRRAMRPLDTGKAQNMSQEKFLQALNDCAALCRTVCDCGGTVRVPRPGEETELCAGLRCRVLGPSERKLSELRERSEALYAERDEAAFLRRLTQLDAAMNNYSLILLLVFQGTRLLLPGDTNRAGYSEIDPAALRAALFKVGHHGQADGADEPLLDAVRPKAVVCCASSDRRYNSADPSLLQMIRGKGAALYFSDCPPAPDGELPPHGTLVFTVGKDGIKSAKYL